MELDIIRLKRTIKSQSTSREGLTRSVDGELHFEDDWLHIGKCRSCGISITDDRVLCGDCLQKAESEFTAEI